MARRRRNRNWGGRRKGAGAPRGNLNAVVRGRYSRQLQALRALRAGDSRVERSPADRPAAGNSIKKIQSR